MGDSKQEVSQGQRSAGAFRNIFVANAKDISPEQCVDLSHKAVDRITSATETATKALNAHPFIANASKLDIASEEARLASVEFLEAFKDLLRLCIRISMSVRYAVLVARACSQLQQVDITADIPDIVGPVIPTAVKAYDELYGRLMHFFTQACMIAGNMREKATEVLDLLRSMGDVTVSVHQMYESETLVATNVFHFENVTAVCEKILAIYTAASTSEHIRGTRQALVTGGWQMTLLAMITSHVNCYIQRYVSYSYNVELQIRKKEGMQVSPEEIPAPLVELLDLESDLALQNYKATAKFNLAFSRFEGTMSRQEASDGIFEEFDDIVGGRYVVAPFPSP
jgi:hypothetical protein